MIQLMQNLASPANHYIAERGELHALSCPCSQVDPQRALHFGNPLGDGRLRHIERTGNGFDLLQICQGNQDTQVLQLQSRIKELFDRVFFRSEEHTSELQSLMRISYAVFCLNKKNKINNTITQELS